MINVTKYLTDDLRKPKYKGNKNPLAGHCYIACEVLFHLYPGKYKACFIKHEGEPHWFLLDRKTKRVQDPTAGQFTTPVPYENGRGIGFLTKAPSKRAKVVLKYIRDSSRGRTANSEFADGGSNPSSRVSTCK